MNTVVWKHGAHSRSGISLLEVLISIGILSIGLLATLSLIPAGRTYMKKAAVDDRAAALVPNAYATMRTLGLFGVSALSWSDMTDDELWNFIDSNTEVWRTTTSHTPVLRWQSGVDVFTMAGSKGFTLDAGWTPPPSTLISADPSVNPPAPTDSEVITTLWSQNMPPLSIVGSAISVPPPSAADWIVNISCAPSSGPNGPIAANHTTGAWSFPVPPSLRPMPAPGMSIIGSGTARGKLDPPAPTTPYKAYSFTANYVDAMGTTQPLSITMAGWPNGPGNASPSPGVFYQYCARRKVDHRTGYVWTTYTLPPNGNDINHTPATCYDASLTNLENAVTQGRGTIARSVSRTVNGILWRMELGTRRGTYHQDIDFADVDNAPGVPRPAGYPNTDITLDAGDCWVDGSGNPIPKTPDTPDSTPEDIDWYRFDVDAGDTFAIEWNDPDNVLLRDSGYEFPIYLNTTTPSANTLLTPIASLSGATKKVYSIPNDGFVITRAQLKPATIADIPGLLNTFGPAGSLKSSRINPVYDFTVTQSLSDRVVVIDPLMATRLDKVLSLRSSVGRFDPYYLRRHRFADFQQSYGPTGTPRAFIIPRLNWQKFASGNVDTMLAMAEKLFREQDSIGTDLSTNDDTAPSQIFDLTGANVAVRRQTEGKMSWLLMVQPEDPGPVASNWSAGKYFDVSIVIFENRLLPPLVAAPALEGEYALKATWSDLDGMITVEVPRTGPTQDLDEDDVRDLFKTGSWILVAPQTVYNDSPLDSTQRLDWVRVQTARIEKGVNNAIVVHVLPETEPAENILYRTSGSTSCPILVLTYQGVVAVVNKSMQLDP